MRLLLLAAFLCGCGSDDSKSKDTPKPKPEVARVNLEKVYCTGGKCAVNVGSDISDGSTLVGTTYKFATSFAAGASAPAACDGSSRVSDLGNEKILVTDLAAATTYSFRGCVFDAADGSYTPGVTATISVP